MQVELRNGIAVVKVNPVQYTIAESANTVYAGIYIDHDNAFDHGRVGVIRMDENYNQLGERSLFDLRGEAYDNWEGSNESTWALGLTLMHLTAAPDEEEEPEEE